MGEGEGVGMINTQAGGWAGVGWVAVLHWGHVRGGQRGCGWREAWGVARDDGHGGGDIMLYILARGYYEGSR